MIVFYETDGRTVAHPAWYHHMRDEVVQNPYSYTSTSQFACNKDRGNPNAQLYSSTTSSPIPRAGRAWRSKRTRGTVVLNHVSACESQVQFVNMVAVDFYELDENATDGKYSVVRIADYLNGF